MRAIRLVLVLILLAAMTRAGEAQLLPRRRVAVRVGNMMADFGGRVTLEAMNEGLKQATDELGDALDLRLSLATFAQIQMAPRANQPIKRGSQQDRPKQDCLGLLLAETARLAARLEEEDFSPPVLEKMVLDYEGIGLVRPAGGDGKVGEWSSRKIEAGRSVTCIERHRPQDPGSKSPKSVHCSFVFLTSKEGQEFRKTVDFDLVLDKEKKEGPPVSPWKVKNVQYDKPAVEPKVSGRSTEYPVLSTRSSANPAVAQPAQPKDGPLGMKFVPVPKGTFFMGWNGKEGSAKKTEIKEDFEMAIYTVTQGQWQEVMGKNPSWFSRDGARKDNVKEIKDEDLQQFPVENVSWEEAQEFIKKLNEKEQGQGYRYRLPSDAEWEYACRGGATSKEDCSYHFYFEKPTSDLSSTQANFNGTVPFGKGEKGPNLGRPAKVGSYAPNKLGLYDMHGNVWQWCEDLYSPKVTDRVLRGGCWLAAGVNCEAANRVRGTPAVRRQGNAGFRLARVPVRDT